MRERQVVIVDAVRSPVGRRNGELSTGHAMNVLGDVQKALFDRTGMDLAEVGQVVGGCVDQVGMQTMNAARGAWLAATCSRCPPSTPSAGPRSKPPTSPTPWSNLESSMPPSPAGRVDEPVPMGSTTKVKDYGRPVNKRYWEHYEFTSQFEGAERIADKWTSPAKTPTTSVSGAR